MTSPYKIACIGSGNLTKGLLYPLFRDAGYDVTILCLTRNGHDALSSGYVFTEVGERPTRHEYTDVHSFMLDALPPDGLAEYSLITTAVGRENLPKVAETLTGRQLHPSLQLLVCENDLDCFRILQKVAPRVYPVVTDRIVYSENKRRIIGESYYSLKAFSREQDTLPEFITGGTHFKKDYTIKLYLVNTLHSIAAWHGFALGYQYINEALRDEVVSLQIENAAKELIGILRHKFPSSSRTELTRFFQNTVDRFANPDLFDPITRVGRNATRKLARFERFLEPVCFARQHGLPYAALLRCASYGLIYHAEIEDESRHEDQEELFSYIESI